MLRRVTKRLFGFLFFLLLFLWFVTPQVTHAADKVTTAVNMNYSISTSGNTHVTAHFALTNTTTNFYVSSYSLRLGFPHVSNVSASDANGAITPVISSSPQGQQVSIQFNSVVYGLGKTLPFTISFDTPDITSQNGSIWEVNIPGLADQNAFTDFSVDLSVPPSFGRASFIKPDVGSDSLHFTKDQLGKSGISITFGSKQTYAYSLLYHLENTNVFPVRTEIALPPTTNYQDVSLDSLSPQPTNVTLDLDGNWLAMYSLSPSQKLTVSANGLIAVSLTPKISLISGEQRQLYLSKKDYWQVDNPQIVTLAHQLKTPEAIYHYVSDHLTYDFNRVANDQVRVGALGVLQNPTSAVCLEFTDLFVTLARAAGIPAREIDGYGYTQNTISRPLSLSKDVLHAWPEYYDDTKKTWIMVDPTWGNTTGGVDYFHTFDFDHIAFVLKGASSVYPVPAGGYKFAADQNRKDVSVSISSETITAEPTVSLDVMMKPTFLSFLPIGGSVSLQNTGAVLFPASPMTVTANLLTPKQQFLTVDALPPFGKLSRNFSFGRTSFLTNERDIITITLDGKTVTQQISVVPLTYQVSIIGGIILAILTAIIWLIAASTRRVPVSQ